MIDINRAINRTNGIFQEKFFRTPIDYQSRYSRHYRTKISGPIFFEKSLVSFDHIGCSWLQLNFNHYKAIQMEETILTLAEAARFLRVSERTLWQLSKDGFVPHFRVGKQFRYLRSKLIEHAANESEA